MISVAQIRAARALLGLTQKDLAELAGISLGTLNNIERGTQGDPKLSTMKAVQRALEAAGVEFTDERSGGVGVRFSRSVTNGANPLSVLIIDDNDADRLLYASWLSRQNGRQYSITEAGNAKDGYDAFVTTEPDLILLDFMMYGKDGFQLLMQMKKNHSRIPPIIFVTAMPSDNIRQSVLAMGAKDYLNKNHLTKDVLYTAVDKALSTGS